MNLYTWQDTIIALSTPQGVSGIAVIRLSGEQAFEVINKIYHKKDLSLQNSHTAHVGYLEYQGEVLDEVVLTIFKNPTSYTGENMVEISCHGSPFVVENIIKTCVHIGARLALPGEFTQRAFINGKIDLTQAEAVADIIHAQSQAATRLALQNIRGHFSKDIATLREQLIQFTALLELELDFSEEDIEFVDRTQLKNLLENILQKVQQLSQSFGAGNAIKQGVKVAIIGKPNAGKSTLLNALLNEERVLVSDIAGTTRDAIEETIFIQGIRFRLIDTAGLRDTTDFLEGKAIERSQKIMQEADAILYIFDITQTSLQDIAQVEKEYPIIKEKKTLWVANKIDMATSLQKEIFAHLPNRLFISAKEKTDIENLKNMLLKTTIQYDLNTNDTIITNVRHYEALKKIEQQIGIIFEAFTDGKSADLITSDVNVILRYLSEITGQVSNKDILDYIFANFCIGK